MTRPNLFKRRGTRSFRTNNAVLLSPRYAQTCKAMGLKRAFPRTELFLRQLVETASFLESNLAATHRCDHGGLAAHYPPVGRRRWQALHGRHSDRQLTGKRGYWAMRGGRGSSLASTGSVGSRPVKTDRFISAIIAPFHRFNPCAFTNFWRFLAGLSSIFFKNIEKPDWVGTGATLRH